MREIALEASRQLDEDSVVRNFRITASANKLFDEADLGRDSVCAEFAQTAFPNRSAGRIPMKMTDWRQLLDTFLKFNEYEVLSDPGKGSVEAAKKLAEELCEMFRYKQEKAFESDFEHVVNRIEGGWQ